MTGKIFISYRRGDNPGMAGRLFDSLQLAFGPDQIFMDVDGIEPGQDFVQTIVETVGLSRVMLVVIGESWASALDSKGSPRLENPHDFVRREIEEALRLNIPVFPLLVGGANFPDPTSLPKSLHPLLRRHAAIITYARYKEDVESIIKTLSKYLIDDESLAQIPPPESIPAPESVAFQFSRSMEGPINLAVPTSSGNTLSSETTRAEDYKELRTKGFELSLLGSNRLGDMTGPVARFLDLPEQPEKIRTELFWSRINTLRTRLAAHEQITNAKGSERDERQLDQLVAVFLKDFVETANIFMLGEPRLLELEAARPGPQEISVAKEELSELAPVIRQLSDTSDIASREATDAIQEQFSNVNLGSDTLFGRQAADFGKKTLRNFVGELLRRAIEPYRQAKLTAVSEATFAYKSMRDGAYKAAGATGFAALASETSGYTHYHNVFADFVVRNAEALSAYIQKAFDNPTVLELIRWIVRFAS